MKYALDTNAIVAALNGVPQVTTRLAGLQAADIVLPAPAIAELYWVQVPPCVADRTGNIGVRCM